MMIFNFSICGWDWCEERYFEVDNDLTKEEIIEKIHEAFRNHIKNTLDEDSKRPLREKLYCTEKEQIGKIVYSKELDKELEKVGLKKVKIQNYRIFEDDDAYALLGMEAKCRGVENCQKSFCDKVKWWKEERKRWKEEMKKHQMKMWKEEMEKQKRKREF